MQHPLIQGYLRFRQNRYLEQQKLYETLAEGQSPKTMIIACADSRVDPATIFDARPGELFVIRNVANIVPPANQEGAFHGTAAGIEFAATALGVEEIIIFGHASCGGIKACLHDHRQDHQTLSDSKYLGPWVQLADESISHVLADHHDDEEALQTAAEHRSIIDSIERLKEYPFVAERIADRSLKLGGAWFSVRSGELHWLDTDSGQFSTISEL